MPAAFTFTCIFIYRYLHKNCSKMNVRMEASWKEVLAAEFKKPYFKQVTDHIKTEKEQGKTIFPAGPNIFHAFDATPLSRLKW